MAEWERRRFRVAGCRKGFGCRWSTPKRHTTQIRSENWGKERGVGPNPTLSLSLSHFKVLLCLGDSSVSRSCLWRTQNFFKKKKRKGEHSSGIDFRSLTSTRVGHGYLAKIVVSRQHSLDVYDAYALHRIFFFFFFLEKRFHTVHELQQFWIVIDANILYYRHYNSKGRLYIDHI